jgi:hypothetical protein
MKTIPTIDCHVEGLRLRLVLRHEDEFLVAGAGGEGHWYTDGELESIAEVTNFDATFAVYSQPGWADRAETTLNRWQAEGTPLTATGLPTVNVLSDGTEKVVFPRTKR